MSENSRQIPSFLHSSQARIGLGVSLFVLIAIGFAFRSVRQFDQKLLSPLIASLHVQIESPESELQISAGQFLPFQVSAFSSAAISSVELWADNQLVDLIPGPEGAQGPFTALLTWQPLSAGQHILIARAHDSDGASGDSKPILIEVTPNESLTPADFQRTREFAIEYSGPSAAALPNFDAPQDGHPGPQESQPYSPVSSWLGQIFSEAPIAAPMAPSLAAQAKVCDVLLTFADSDEHENGFRIYRAQANSPNWLLIATLGSADGGLLTFQDSGISGQIIYRVAAFNAQGESLSNPASVNIPPENCSSPPAPAPFVQILFSDFELQTPVDDAYCYVGGGDKPWIRWPAQGFLQNIDGQFDINNPVILSQLFPEGSESVPLDLELNCWGWQSGALLFLGHSQYQGELPGTPFEFALGNANFDLLLQTELSFGNPQFNYSEGVDFSDYLMRPEGLPIVGDVNLCQSRYHSDSGFPDDFCTNSFGHSSWPYEPTYLIWNHDYEKNCVAGIDCIDPANPGPVWENVPGIAGGEFGYEILMQSGWQGDIPTPLNRVFALPAYYGGTQCNQSAQINVATYFIPEGSSTRYRSQGSWVEVPLPCRTADFAIMEIAIEQVWIVNPYEESDEGDEVDLFGYFALIDQFYGGQGKRLGAWGDNYSVFDAQCIYMDYQYPNFNCPTSVSADETGIYDVNEWRMCTANQAGNDCWFAPTVNIIQGNNVFDEITIVDWNALDTALQSPQVWVKLWDWDINSGNDVVCEGYMSLADANYPFAAYNDFHDYTLGFTFYGSGDNGTSCIVQLSLTELFSLIVE